MNPLSAAGRTIYVVFDAVLGIIYWLVLIWVILSWLMLFASQTSFRWKHRGVFNALVMINDFFTRATHPLLRPFRKLLPPWKTAGIDWSPLLLLITIFAIRYFLALVFGPVMY